MTLHEDIEKDLDKMYREYGDGKVLKQIRLVKETKKLVDAYNKKVGDPSEVGAAFMTAMQKLKKKYAEEKAKKIAEESKCSDSETSLTKK